MNAIQINSKGRRHIKALERRADHLAKRLAQAADDGRELGFDRQECAAIQWALDVIQGKPNDGAAA